MSPAAIKKLVVVTSLCVLAGSVGFLLVACGAENSASPAQPRSGTTSAGWHALPSAPIRVDGGLTSVWSGKEMIVSGVRAGPDGTFIRSTEVAAAYDPSARTWRRLARPPKTENYCRRGAAWTGTEMLVWGCSVTAYNPAENGWRRLPSAPTGQGIVVWTGHALIGWGGGCCGDASADGSAYEPATNTWHKLAPSPLAPEQGAIGAWTGRELVLFVSGTNPGDGKPWPARLARAAAYSPETDTWRRLAPLPESGIRFGGTGVWNGHEVVVVGAGSRSRDALAYNPAANRWRRLSALPSGRVNATAVWTGSRVLVQGAGTGMTSTRPPALAYDPKADRWSTLPRAPLRGLGPTVVWTGHRLIVWGGVIPTPAGSNSPARAQNTGAAFVPKPRQ